MKTQPKGPFLGVNNRRADFDLHFRGINAKGDYLREAINVDIDGTGNIRRRKAAELVQAVSGSHSLHGLYLVRASALYRITLPGYSETLVKILTSNAPMSYAEYNGDIYYSNGVDSGRISAAGAVYPWALPTPEEPSVTTISGLLPAGSYQVAVSYFNATTGEEGGVSASNNYPIEGNRALRVAIPPAVTGATHVKLYCSTVDGSIPFLQTTVAVGTTFADIASIAIGAKSMQRYEDPLPAGTRIFEFNGQLCSVVGKRLYFGIPCRLGYYLPVEGYIDFPDPIATSIGYQEGVYVSTTKLTHYFPGTQLGRAESDATVADVLPYGGVPGTEFVVPNKSGVGWFGAKGLVIADTKGEVQAVMSDNVDLIPPASGVSTVFETNGYRRVVSCGWCVNLDNLAVTSYVGYDFTSANGGYGTMADGIYKLEGSGDIGYSVGFGRENFGSEQLKVMPAIYLGADSTDPLQVRIKTPGQDYTYAARSAGADTKIQRVDPGKGLRANWFDLSLVSNSGPEFTLATVSFATLASTRRV